MCGIIGLISKNPITNSEEGFVSKGLKQITHRGPDFQKVHMIDDHVVFGHARLSIIDISNTANQPMLSSDGLCIIVYNGEIYNYRELRDDLQKHYEFFSNSDTEVIIACYQIYGIRKTLDMLDGFFAFALYDIRSKKMFLARDKIGKKPLYICKTEDHLYFSSETRVFKNISGFSSKLSYETMQNVFMYKYSKHLSIFSDVEMLDMGTYLEIGPTTFKTIRHKYFSIEELVSETTYHDYAKKKESDLLDRLDVLLQEAVKKRLFTSDVPVCSINSGGLDSSLISSIAARYRQIDLFHVDVENRSEHKYAVKLQNHLNLPMYSLKLNESNIFELFRKASIHYEYYMVHLNNAGIYLLAGEIGSKGYKVVLGGEAADEIFGGYPHFNQYFKILRFSQLINKFNIEGFLDKLLKRYLFKGLYPFSYLSHNFKPDMSNNPAAIYNKLFFDELSNKYGFIEDKRERFLQTLLLFDFYRYLQPLFLRGDKMFMGNSVEQRLPFADIEVIRFALNLPIHLKKRKYLLKKLAEKYIPKSIIYRPKEGFRIPFDNVILRNKSSCLGMPLSLIDNNAVAIALYGVEIYLDNVFGIKNKKYLMN